MDRSEVAQDFVLPERRGRRSEDLHYTRQEDRMKKQIAVVILAAGSLVGRAAANIASRAVRANRMALLRRRSGRHEVLAADRYRPGERAAAAGRLAVEALGNAAGARLLREHAAHDRRRAVRDDAVQQHGRGRCRNRQGTVAVRRRGRRARSAAVRQRLEAARDRVLARRRQSCASS